MNLSSQNPWVLSDPFAFQFGIFLSCIITSSVVIFTFSWMLTFLSYNLTSFNHSASCLYETGLFQNLLQNSFVSSVLRGTCVDLPFPPNSWYNAFWVHPKFFFVYIGSLTRHDVSVSQIFQKFFVSAPQ